MKREEEQIHRAIIQHLQARGVPDLLYFHCPNAPRNAITGSRLKKMGMLAGVYDLLLFHRGLSFALEIKTDKGRLSPAQDEFETRWLRAGWMPEDSDLDLCGRQHFYACVARGLDHAIKILEAWGLIK